MLNETLNKLRSAGEDLRNSRFECALCKYDELVEELPRSHWIRLWGVFCCIKLGRIHEAIVRFNRISYSNQISEKIICKYKKILDSHSEGLNATLECNTDYYKLMAAGKILPKFRKINSNRKPFPGIPYDFILPDIVGNQNDFSHIVDVRTQNAAKGPAPFIPINFVLFCEHSDILKSVASKIELLKPRFSSLKFTVCSKTLGEQLPCCVDEYISVCPWELSSDKQVSEYCSGDGMLIFTDGSYEIDECLLEYTIQTILVWDRSLVVWDGVLEGSSRRSTVSLRNIERKWKQESYPFRWLKSPNFALSANYFRKLGGFNLGFSSMPWRIMELGFRAYKSGAYFIPLSSEPNVWRFRIQDQWKKSCESDEDLFNRLCPVNWNRNKWTSLIEPKIPKVSIYIPAYNAEAFIKEAVESVLNQDFDDLEVCIFIDGATDKTEDVLERNYADEPRVRWTVGENGGIGFASNRAIRMCRGLFIGQLDSDDCLKQGAISKLAKYLDDNPDIGCVYSSAERIDAAGNFIKNEYNFPEFSREKMFLTSIVHHFRMFRKQAWERTEGFREDIENAVDYDGFLKLSEVTQIQHVNEVLYQRRWHGNNTSSRNESLQTINSYRVQTEALGRCGLGAFWEVYVPDKMQPRKVAYRRIGPNKRVFFWPDYTRSNPYQRLLYYNDVEWVEFYSGGLSSAIRCCTDGAVGGEVIFHLHWTNKVGGSAESVDEYKNITDGFLKEVRRLKQLGGRFIWTIHNLVSHESRFPETEIAFGSALIRLADKVHVHARTSILEMRRVYELPENKIVAIPHGDYSTYYGNCISREGALRELRLNDRKPILLFFGQIRPYKGIEQFLKTVEELGRKIDCRVIVAGKTSPEMRPIIKMYRNRLGNVLLVKDRFIDDSEVEILFKACTVAVFPYKNIHTSGSLMLALTYGCYVVAPAFGMINETLLNYDRAFVYGEGSTVKSLTEAIEKTIKKHSASNTPTCDIVRPNSVVWRSFFGALGNEGNSQSTFASPKVKAVLGAN